jgi:hypothetical protein
MPSRKTRARRPAKSKPAAKKTTTKKAEEAFVESLIASGEAACVDADGKLPAGATHELVETKGGGVKAVRRRFSVY